MNYAATLTTLFKGRSLIVATKHGKENIIQPLFSRFLGVEIFTPKDYDTDTFGTFSGEIERKEDPLTTLKMKCLSAMEHYGYDMGIATEGSFGPHPQVPFFPANDELFMFIDRRNNIEWVTRVLSTDTNFSGAEIYSEASLNEFSTKSKFPSHGLILRPHKDAHDPIIKDITSWDFLYAAFKQLMDSHGHVYAETDMRAMRNPSRMKVIQEAAEKMMKKISSFCPICRFPGYDVVEVQTGLPCSSCGLPTSSVLAHVYICARCSHKGRIEYPNQKHFEEPLYCQYCNP